MKITFLGTGADDWDWTDPVPGTLESTCSLLGATCLLDAGPGVLRGLSAAGIPLSRVSNLLLTHSHGDHFNPAAVLELARAGRRRLRVWGPSAALDVLAAAAAGGPAFEPHPLAPGAEFLAAGFRAIALPANHVVAARFGEEPLHYAFEGRGAHLLYALDGGWMTAKARVLLAAFLRGKPLDAVVWDATCGNTFRDWRFAEHNDLRMIDAMRESMEKAGLAAPSTRHVFDHVARTLWPGTPAARRRLAARFRGVLAEDGLSLDFPPDRARSPKRRGFC